jgi:transglutaminase-like putative cysteine protease
MSASSPRVLTVRHSTTYRYAQPVSLGEHRIMFRPRESHDLRLLRTDLRIAPQPASLYWQHDVFDNSVAVVTFEEEARALVCESTVTLELIESALPDYRLSREARTFPFAYPSDERPDLERAIEQRHPSDELDAWIASFVPPSGTIETATLLRSITSGIHERFAYRRRVERGTQTPTETLSAGSGTCRDFALLMMEGVRSLGFAARFVSGYIFMPDADPGLVNGNGSTHAWLQVYLPGGGWIDFDPTNSIVGNRNLIRVAVAWDPASVLPLWGTYSGPRSAFLGMDVAVSVLDETLEAQSAAQTTFL